MTKILLLGLTLFVCACDKKPITAPPPPGGSGTAAPSSAAPTAPTVEQ